MEITTNGARVSNGVVVTGDPALSILANDVVFFNQNGGEVRATGSTAIQISGARNRIVNEQGAMIRDADSAHTAIAGSSFDDTIENSGTITGRIDLGDGADQFFMNTGILSGPISLGEGADQFVFSGGVVHGLIDLGAGDDIFVVHDIDGFIDGSVAGGTGIDTLICEAGYNVPITSGIERLQVQFKSAFTSFQTALAGEYTDVIFTGTDQYCFANLFQTTLPGTTISIDRVDLALGSGTVVKNVIGSDNSETLEFASAPAYPAPAGTVTGLVDLRGGDDLVNFYSYDGKVHATDAPVSGGAGQDTIAFTTEVDAQLDLASFVDFEALRIGGSFQSSATHTVLHVPDVDTIRILGVGLNDAPTHVVIGATNQANASIVATGNAVVQIAADATTGEIRDGAAEPGSPFIAGIQRIEVAGHVAGDLDLRGENDSVLSQGRIDGSVLLGDGADRYTESSVAASVGGTVEGGAGDDRVDLLSVRGGSAASFNGGAGADLISFLDSSGHVTIDLAAGTANDSSATISVVDFEKAFGTQQADILQGTVGANSLSGFGGDDRLDGLAGDDLLFGDAGNDTILGAAGNDTLVGDTGNDMLSGGDGDDRLDPGLGRNIVDGGAGQDVLVLGSAQSAYSIAKIGTTLLFSAHGEEQRVSGVEVVNFADASVAASELLSRAAPFDALAYIASYNDLRTALGTDAAAAEQHYLNAGFAENRTISFDGLQYIASYRDLIGSLGADPAAGAAHFIRYGAAEGRAPSFDALNYTASYIDLIRAFGTDETAATQHYIRYGAAEGRTAHFDALRYTASYSDLIRAFGTDEGAATAHYIQDGAAEGRVASFDALRYTATYSDLIGTLGIDQSAATRHFINYGYTEGRNAAFDPVGYLLTYSDLQSVGLGEAGALQHWIRFGFSEGRAGDALFGRDQTKHLAQVGKDNADLLQTEGDRDWVALHLQAGEHVNIELGANGFAGHVELHDSDGRLLAQDDGELGSGLI